MRNAIPGDQNENGLLVSQESMAHVGKDRKQNDIILIRSEDIECRNFRYSAASLTEEESLLRLFKIVCQGPECDGLNCNHGCYKAVNKDCHQLLDESDMFMLHIEFLTPIKFCLQEMYWGK